MRQPAALLSALTRTVRAIIGVPDYERYLRHMRARHPDTDPLSRAAFQQTRLEARYTKPGSRCC